MLSCRVPVSSRSSAGGSALSLPSAEYMVLVVSNSACYPINTEVVNRRSTSRVGNTPTLSVRRSISQSRRSTGIFYQANRPSARGKLANANRSSFRMRWVFSFSLAETVRRSDAIIACLAPGGEGRYGIPEAMNPTILPGAPLIEHRGQPRLVGSQLFPRH